jgi:NDP-sugar pyrophosphorylase family protein
MSNLQHIKKEIENTQVNLLVGGKAKRMNNEIKCLKEINGIPLIERTLKQYADHGFRKFNILSGYGYEEVESYIKKKSKCAKLIDLSFSLDDTSWKAGGKGKALKQALKNNVIDKNKRSVVVFPDDVFVDGTIPLQLMNTHLNNMKSLVTVATVPGTDYPYGEVILDSSGKVKRFVEKPFVPKNTSTGLYVIEPEVYSEINKMINQESDTAQEFEIVVLEKLAKEGKVANYTITPYDSWIPVNTSKEFETAKLRLEKLL